MNSPLYLCNVPEMVTAYLDDSVIGYRKSRVFVKIFF